MRKLLKLLKLLILLPLMVLVVSCSNDEPKRNLPKKQQPCPPGIYLYYTNGTLAFYYNAESSMVYFSLPSGVKYIDIEAENLTSQIIYKGRVWTDNPVWEQKLPTGEYLFICTTDKGKVYKMNVRI